MLEYKKQILLKVSHYPEIFRRELVKAMKRLEKHELELLKDWCLENFSDTHFHILRETIIEERSYQGKIL